MALWQKFSSYHGRLQIRLTDCQDGVLSRGGGGGEGSHVFFPWLWDMELGGREKTYQHTK